MEMQKDKGKMSLFKKIGASFKQKGFRSGVYATVTSILVIGAIIITNLIVNAMGVQKDLTATGEKSLTAETEELLAGLEDEITFYFLTKEEKLPYIFTTHSYLLTSKRNTYLFKRILNRFRQFPTNKLDFILL